MGFVHEQNKVPVFFRILYDILSFLFELLGNVCVMFIINFSEEWTIE